MATTFVDYTGDGNATKAFSFPSYKVEDIKVEVDNVIKTVSTHYNITSYTTTGGGNVVFTSGNIPASPAAIRIFRDTDVDSAKATYTAGSSVKAADLNNNMTQLLYAAQEEQNQTILTSNIKDAAVTTAKIKPDNITNALIADDQIDSEHYVDGSIDTAHIADSQITSAKIADGTIVAGDLASNAITTVKITDSNVTTAKIADSNITTAKIADSNITTVKIAANAVNGTKIANDSINSEHYVDGSIDTAHIADSQVTTTKLASDAVTTVKITDLNVTTAKIADGSVTTDKIAADAVTNAKIADDSINSEHYVDGSIDTAHIADNAVTNAKIADNAVTQAKIATGEVTSSKLADLAVTTAKLGNSAVTAAKIASNAVTTDKIADSELSTLAGMQSTTASNLASSTALTATTAELNQLDGITLETSVTGNSDTRIPTSKAVNDLVLSVTNALGGFVAIANETSFPTANPDPSNGAGTVVSISQLANGLLVNSSGVATIGNGAGSGNTVTITGFPSSLVSQTLPATSGLQVQTTSTLHTYTFHKQLASAADIQAISATVNSFSNRYRVSASAPTSSLDGGDLWYDTTNSKLMVYSSQNSAWEESSAIGNFFISTISSSSNTGGGSATANGTAYRFTISDAPVSAQQLIVSVDGVIQKPNSGTSQPSEGFALSGNDIIFGSAPVNGASIFIIVIGSTVGIGTPSDNTVTTAILQNGSVTTAKITDANVTTAKIADANVTTAKIADDAVTAAKLANTSVSAGSYGSSTSIPSITVDAQGRITAASGNTVNTDLVGDTSPQLGGNLDVNTKNIVFGDSAGTTDDRLTFGAGTDLSIYHTGVNSYIEGSVRIGKNNNVRITDADDNTIIKSDGASAYLAYEGNDKLQSTNTGVTVTGNIVTTGTVTGGGVFNSNVSYGGTAISLGDNQQMHMGASSDLKILHDSANSYLSHTGAGNFYIQADPLLEIRSSSNAETYAKFIQNGAVELYYDSVKKFGTTSQGATVTGSLTTTSSATINGVLTVEADSDERLRIEVPSNNADDWNYISFYGANGTRDGFLGTWADGTITLQADGGSRLKLYGSYVGVVGSVIPETTNTYDLGSTSGRWANVYTNDLHLSNEGHTNSVDGTWGDWTIQEGESDLFLKNNRSGKKYKFNLTEVS